MTTPTSCPQCSAPWSENLTCQDHFYQMLYWENEFPGHGIVHHLAVLCYHLQHPNLYSSAGLEYGKGLLVDFVERGISPQEVRQQRRTQVASGRRQWKVTARPSDSGAYAHPVRWRMTAADVTAAGAENYIESVRAWAQATYEDLKTSGNL